MQGIVEIYLCMYMYKNIFLYQNWKNFCFAKRCCFSKSKMFFEDTIREILVSELEKERMSIKEIIALQLQCEIQDKIIKLIFTWHNVERTGIFNNQTDKGSEPSSCRVKVTVRSIKQMQQLEGVWPTIKQKIGTLKNCLNLNYILVISTLWKPL